MIRPVVFALFALLLGAQAFGHAKLRSSVPAEGAKLFLAPATLQLHFNESVKLASVVIKSAGGEITVAVDRAAAASADVTLPLPALGTGRYVVQWRALSGGDGHVTHGTVSFVIAGAVKR
jgi:methionine-rich copper-binding protein CopC